MLLFIAKYHPEKRTGLAAVFDMALNARMAAKRVVWSASGVYICLLGWLGRVTLPFPRKEIASLSVVGNF